MAKKQRPKRRRLRSCENNGGLGILPCESHRPGDVTLEADPSFIRFRQRHAAPVLGVRRGVHRTCEGVRRGGGGRRRFVMAGGGTGVQCSIPAVRHCTPKVRLRPSIDRRNKWESLL